VRKTSRVLIVGGGVIGICSAYYLARSNWDVIVADMGGICSGCSYGNAGFILPSHAIPLAAPGVLGKGLRWLLDRESPFYIKPRPDLDLLFWLLRFASSCKWEKVRRAIPIIHGLHLASMALYEELVSVEGLRFGFKKDGMLMLFRTEDGYEEGIREARLLEEYGIRSRVLDSGEVREMEPSILPSVAGGVFYPDDACLNPADFVMELAGRARDLGARIVPDLKILGFYGSMGRISRVKTSRGDLDVDYVVLAAGAWSGVIGKRLSLKLPIQPAKGYSITGVCEGFRPNIPMLLKEDRVAVTPLGERVRFSGTLELCGFDLSIDRIRLNAVLKSARRYIGGLGGVDTAELWAGLRPCTPDGLPIIGRASKWENLVIATGHSTIGQALGPITGKLISQILGGEKPELDISPFSPERFSG
jgi:D-amino-acid dehydrogenase